VTRIAQREGHYKMEKVAVCSLRQELHRAITLRTLRIADRNTFQILAEGG